MLGGKWIILFAAVSFVYSTPVVSGTHESLGVSGLRGARFHHKRRHHQQQNQIISLGSPVTSGINGITGILNPNSNSYLGCVTYMPTSNYSGFPDYSFGYWSPSNGGYGVNYTQPGIYKSYQYGPYNYGYGYPSTIYGPYTLGSYPSYTSGYTTGYPGYGLSYPGYTTGYPSYGITGFPSYGTGYGSYPQIGFVNNPTYGSGSNCILLCPVRAGF